MTLEEFLERIDEIMCGTSNAERAYLADLYDEVTKPHWISVEDELPKDGEKVLGYNPNFNAPLVCDCYAGKFGEGWSYFDSGFITHWMPMPEAPHHIIDANKKVDRVIGTADHIKTALDVLNTKGGEK